jgi:hypothetical protein
MKAARIALALGLAWIAQVGVACSSTPEEPEPAWVSLPGGRPLVAPSEQVLWEVTVFALERLYLTLGTVMDPAALVATSGWKNELAPFRGRGRRVQAEVRFEPLGGGRYDVVARVKCQRNMSLVNQLDPTYAEWEWAPDDQDRATILLQHIRARLLPAPELREEPEERRPG